MMASDRDTLIRLAIAPADTVQAPADLGDEIMRAVLATPQRRPLLGSVGLSSLRFLPTPVRQLAPVLLLLALLLVVGLVIAIASRPPALSGGLTMYHGGPARTGEVAGSGPAGQPFIAWKASRSGAMSQPMMPAVSRGIVVIGDGSGGVTALDEATGVERWSATVGSPINASAAIVGDLVILGSDDGNVTAFTLVNGRVAWRFTAGGAVTGSLLATADTLFAGGEDGLLYALDPATGAERWSFNVGGPLTRGAAFVDGVLYVGAKGGRVMAIDGSTHHAIWTRELGPGEIGTPAVADGLLYISRGLEGEKPPHDLLALDVRDGATRWTLASEAQNLQMYFAAAGSGVVYAVSKDQNVYALDPATGARRWTFRTDGPIGAVATLADGVLYVAPDDRTVRALDAKTGAQLWSIKVDGVPTGPAVIDGRVIVGTNLGKVEAISGTGNAP